MSLQILVLLVILVPVQAQEAAFAPITPANAAQLEVIRTFNLNGNTARQLLFNPTNSGRLAVVQSNKIVSLWHVGTGFDQWLSEIALPNQVTSIAYTAEGNRLVTADTSGDVKIWDLTQPFNPMIHLIRIEGEIPLRVDTSENYLLAVLYDSGITRLWHLDSMANIITLYGYEGRDYLLDLRSDGRRIAIGYPQGPHIFIYDIDFNTPGDVSLRHVYESPEILDLVLLEDETSPLFMESGLLMAVGNHGIMYANEIHPSSPNTWTTGVRMYYPRSIAVNSTGRLVAIAGMRESVGGPCTVPFSNLEVIHFFPDQGGAYFLSEVAADLKEHTSCPTEVTFSADDRFLASAEENGIITIWGISQP